MLTVNKKMELNLLIVFIKFVISFSMECQCSVKPERFFSGGYISMVDLGQQGIPKKYGWV